METITGLARKHKFHVNSALRYRKFCDFNLVKDKHICYVKDVNHFLQWMRDMKYRNNDQQYDEDIEYWNKPLPTVDGVHVDIDKLLQELY